MDDRISKLAEACAVTENDEPVNSDWVYEECLALLDAYETFDSNELWSTLIDAARALNDSGEYALGGEIFESLLEHGQNRQLPKLEFDALEGLADAWFYLGDKKRAMGYLEQGLKLAIKLDKKDYIENFQISIDFYKTAKSPVPGS